VTDSAFYLGVLGAVEFVPVIPASLLAGAVADTWDRRRIVIVAQLAALACAAALAFGADAGVPQLALILVIAFTLHTCGCFENPASAALLPGLVSRELFPAATVLNSNVRNLAAVSGPVLMGFATSYGSIALAYGIAAFLMALSILALARVRSPERTGAVGSVSTSAIREGIAFVRHQPVILGSMVLDMIAVIFAGVTALLPVYADQILGVGELGYGLLSASIQIGTLAMAGLLLVARPLERPGRALLLSVVIFGLATIVFGFSRSFALSVAALAISGMADQVSMVARSIILQLSTPDALRGRVNSVNMIFIGASNELGAAESGFLAAVTTATFSVVFGGVACVGVAGALAAAVPTLYGYRVPASLEELEGAPRA